MKKNILLLINGFGIEQKDSYDIYCRFFYSLCHFILYATASCTSYRRR